MGDLVVQHWDPSGRGEEPGFSALLPCTVVFSCQLEKPQYKGLTQRGLFFSRNRKRRSRAAVLLGVIQDPGSFCLSAQPPLAYGFPPNTR